jgi:hypothetical protein
VNQMSNKEEELQKLLHISIILIFIAHATITNSKQPDLQSAFSLPLPATALAQIRQFILVLTDRVLVVPSIWQMPLTPILAWLSVHKDDGLCDFVLNREVKTELRRIHALIDEYQRTMVKRLKETEE